MRIELVNYWKNVSLFRYALFAKKKSLSRMKFVRIAGNGWRNAEWIKN
jgi:hypothetical protein